MWLSSSRQVQLLCAPLIRVAVNVVSPLPKQSATVCTRNFHLLTSTTTDFAHHHQFGAAAQYVSGQRPLLDVNNAIPLVGQSCGFKFKRVLKRRCKDCYFVVRENRLQVICKTHPRHKQLAITRPEKSTWILTHAMQSKVRPY